MSKSEEFLRQAFAGESQANRKYLAFSQAAERDGYPQVAKLFRAAAEAETVHAINHLRALKAIKSTKENLQEAISGEIQEYKEMYPEMLASANAEANREAERSFKYALDVEKVHANLYQQALEQLLDTKEQYPYYVCPICGYTVEREAPETCPVCGAKGRVFKRID